MFEIMQEITKKLEQLNNFYIKEENKATIFELLEIESIKKQLKQLEKLLNK